MSRIGDNGGPAIRDGNWIAISRDLIDHHIVGAGNVVPPDDKNKGSFSRLESWLDLLMLANWAERKIDNKGVVTILRPGQTLAGRAFLAKRWNWTEKTVRVWLERLEREMMITLFCENAKLVNASTLPERGQTKGHTRNVLTICNWGKYQLDQLAQGPDLGRPQGHPGATQGPQKNKGTKEQEEREEREDEALPSVADATPPPIEALRAFEAYNALALRIGLAQSRTLTPQRRKSLCARLREHGPDSWATALANIERSAFLRGNNSRNWRLDFDFLIKAASYAKVVDGTYGNGAHGDTLKKDEPLADRLARYAAELEHGQ